jgi:glycogen debranching enzyme
VFAVTPWMGDPNAIVPLSKTYTELDKEADADYDAWRVQQATISTSDKKFNAMIEQIYRDIYILREQTPRGPAIAAGLPWFACAFGRDDAITSLQTLPLMPDLSRDVLRTLAAYQGTTDNQKTAEKPGKIMHELRVGEMARNHEIPFAPYYGTVDATPLWLMLLGRYVEQTGDLSLARELQPNVDCALQYLDAEIARGNGYLRYGGVGKEALSNQGWKDSGDSVFYPDGRLAQPPIALCEVQSYLYIGWRLMAKIFRAEGNEQRAAELEQKAAALQQRFQQDFWMPKRKFVAQALDGQNAQVGIITSNGGQVLMSHLLTADQQAAVSNRLMQPDMFSGFGIRTLGREQARYFSNSYHNGSIWPHDNSLIAWGLHDCSPIATALLMRSLFAVAQHEDDLRLPELFGGYSRNVCKAVIPYPVACKPQAWADGAMLLMFAAGAGLHIDGLNNKVTVDHLLFPDELGTVTLQGLHVGANRIDLQFKPTATGWNVGVINNPGKVTVVIQ